MIDYYKEINDYGKSLSEKEKPIARSLFNSLIKKDEWNYERLYYAIQQLNGRPISKYKGLFYYDDFLNEIDNKIEELHITQKRIAIDIRKQQEERANRPVIKIKMVEREPRKMYIIDDI